MKRLSISHRFYSKIGEQPCILAATEPESMPSQQLELPLNLGTDTSVCITNISDPRTWMPLLKSQLMPLLTPSREQSLSSTQLFLLPVYNQEIGVGWGENSTFD